MFCFLSRRAVVVTRYLHKYSSLVMTLHCWNPVWCIDSFHLLFHSVFLDIRACFLVWYHCILSLSSMTTDSDYSLCVFWLIVWLYSIHCVAYYWLMWLCMKYHVMQWWWALPFLYGVMEHDGGAFRVTDLDILMWLCGILVEAWHKLSTDGNSDILMTFSFCSLIHSVFCFFIDEVTGIWWWLPLLILTVCSVWTT